MKTRAGCYLWSSVYANTNHELANVYIYIYECKKEKTSPSNDARTKLGEEGLCKEAIRW